MIVNAELVEYLERAVRALDVDAHALADAARVSARCTECGDVVEDAWLDETHIVHVATAAHATGERVTVLVGCEGYWVIDPNVLGLERQSWEPAGTRFDEDDEADGITLSARRPADR